VVLLLALLRLIGRIIIGNRLWMIFSSSRMSLRLRLGGMKKWLRLLLRRSRLPSSRLRRCWVGLGCRGRVLLLKVLFACWRSWVFV
jgi:hypothetical protein